MHVMEPLVLEPAEIDLILVRVCVRLPLSVSYAPVHMLRCVGRWDKGGLYVIGY